MIIKTKRSKYGNKKQVYDGIRFDSTKECGRYVQLKLMEKQKLIRDLQVHPRFKVFDGFEKLGKKFLPITYIADFEYFDKGQNKTIIEDVKGGVETVVFRIKRKLFEARYAGLTITIIK